MPTEVIHTIGPGRDYPTLSAWATAEAKDLVAADEIAVAECYNDAVLTDNVVLTGWTTDTEHYIKIYTPASERHDGVKDTGFTITPATPTKTIEIQQRHVRIEGIAFKSHSDSAFMECIHVASQTYCDIRISHCLFYGEPVSDPHDDEGIHIFYSEGVKVWNNFFFSLGKGVFSEGSDNIDVENNTLWDCDIALYSTSHSMNPAYRNNIAFSYSGRSFYQRIWFVQDTDYNLDNANNTDYQCPGAHSLHDKDPAANLVDVTRGTANLHIRPDAPDVIAKGTDGTHICFTDDIDGQPRPQGIGWNIGADELEAEEFVATGVGSLYSGKEQRDEIPNLEGPANENYALLGGTLENAKYIEPNHVGNIHQAIVKMQNVLGVNPQGNRPNIHRRIWRSINPVGDVMRIRNVELNESDIRDGKILVFKEDLWELRYEDKTLGADVISLQGATGDVDVKEGPGIETIYKSGGNGVHIRAEVTQTELDAVDAKTGKVGTRDVNEAAIDDGKILAYNFTQVELQYQDNIPAGVKDHGALTGGDDDDHLQYHNDTRGDDRYHTKTVLESASAGEGAALIGVEDAEGNFIAGTFEGVLAELHAQMTAKSGVQTIEGGAEHLTLVPGDGIKSIERVGQDITVETEITQIGLNTHIGDDDAHHAEGHDIDSHDTAVSGEELDTLTAGPTSDADDLHRHTASPLFNFQVAFPGTLSEGRELTNRLSIPFDAVGIGVDAFRLWCGTVAGAQMTITVYHCHPADNPASGGDNIATLTLNAGEWSAKGNCSQSFSAGDGLVFDIAGTALPEDLTLSLVVNR